MRERPVLRVARRAGELAQAVMEGVAFYFRNAFGVYRCALFLVSPTTVGITVGILRTRFDVRIELVQIYSRFFALALWVSIRDPRQPVGFARPALYQEIFSKTDGVTATSRAAQSLISQAKES